MLDGVKLGRSDMATLDRAYNFARFLSRDADAAEHMAYVAFVQTGRGFDGGRSDETRILKIVRNSYRAWLTARRKIRRQNNEAAGKRLPDPAAVSILRSDEGSGEIGNSADSVRAAIEALPRRLREVLVLREFGGLSYEGIAEVTSLTTGEIMSRLASARRMLGGRVPTDRPHLASA
jgi:RNA polymerase sigma-70 factor (ECF subfamily)